MSIFKRAVSLLFLPFTKSFKKFKKFWKKRNKFWKVILAILIVGIFAMWFITVTSILGTIWVLNIGILWIQGVFNLTRSIINSGSNKISGKKKRGTSKLSPPRKKKARGGRKSRRKGITRG